jgi:hypothetical protein
MCLFLHDVDVLDVAARLLDLFIASHPLMPMYVGAALVVTNKAEILRQSRDASALHSTMTRLRVADGTAHVEAQLEQTQRVIEHALRIYAEHPPDARTFAFARDSASTRFPYPWLAGDGRVGCAPLDDAIVPRDRVRFWLLRVMDDVRAIMRMRRLRARGLLAAKRPSVPIRSVVFALLVAVFAVVVVAFADHPTIVRTLRAPAPPPPRARFPFAIPAVFPSASRARVRRRRLAFLP